MKINIISTNRETRKISSLTRWRKHFVTKGFSLIELLIVLTIMGLLASIVMPETFNMLDQHKAQLEQKKLIDFVKQHKYKAYLLEREINIEFDGSRISSSLDKELFFEFIETEYQQINISELGSYKQELIGYRIRNRYVERRLVDL